MTVRGIVRIAEKTEESAEKIKKIAGRIAVIKEKMFAMLSTKVDAWTNLKTNAIAWKTKKIASKTAMTEKKIFVTARKTAVIVERMYVTGEKI